MLAKCQESDLLCEASRYLQMEKMAPEYWIGRIDAVKDLTEALVEAKVYEVPNASKWLSGKVTGNLHFTNLDGCKFDF